mgnify:CR=1 FL=1
MLTIMKLLKHTMHSIFFRCVGVTLFAYYEKIAMIALDEGELFQDNVEQLEYDCDEVKECR